MYEQNQDDGVGVNKIARHLKTANLGEHISKVLRKVAASSCTMITIITDVNITEG